MDCMDVEEPVKIMVEGGEEEAEKLGEEEREKAKNRGVRLLSKFIYLFIFFFKLGKITELGFVQAKILS